MRMRMSMIDVGMRLGDAIDPFQLANGFEAVIGYECQERSNHPLSHSYDATEEDPAEENPGNGTKAARTAGTEASCRRARAQGAAT